jgi:uncharacterized protein
MTPFVPFPEEMLQRARDSVLCWLATVDDQGQPNVSPKEIYLLQPPDMLLVAHIASPTTVRNLRQNPRVCASFIDVFVQKGWKVQGRAVLLRPGEPGFDAAHAALAALAGPAFPIHAVIAVRAEAVEPIVAPSYRLHPHTTTEASQVASAMRRYGVRARADVDVG